MLFLVAIGVALSLVCLTFNIVFRNRKFVKFNALYIITIIYIAIKILILCFLLRVPFRIIKLTSPNLNYVIVLGSFSLMVGNVFGISLSLNPTIFAVFCEVSDDAQLLTIILSVANNIKTLLS